MNKLAIEPGIGKRVRLRLLKRDDLPRTLSWRNSDDTRCWFSFSGIIAPEQHLDWYQKYITNFCDYVFIIETRDDVPIGQVSIYNIDWDAKQAEFGRLLIGEPQFKERGLAKEASALVLDLFSSRFDIEKFRLSVKASNQRAIAIYEQLGFIHTGARKDLLQMEYKVASISARSGK